jgi:hypothetical protein
MPVRLALSCRPGHADRVSMRGGTWLHRILPWLVVRRLRVRLGVLLSTGKAVPCWSEERGGSSDCPRTEVPQRSTLSRSTAGEQAEHVVLTFDGHQLGETPVVHGRFVVDRDAGTALLLLRGPISPERKSDRDMRSTGSCRSTRVTAS